MHYSKVCYTLIRKILPNLIKIIFVLFSFSTSLSAQEVTKKYITINDTTNSFFLDSYLHYYNDEDGSLSIEQINKINNDITKNQFSDSLQLTKSTKYIWVYFDIKIESNK